MSSVVHLTSERGAGQPALSIRQPWAELILRGTKTIEIRNWSTDFRGPLWIHTGKQGNPCLELEYDLHELFHGGYVGSCVLQAVIAFDCRRWELWKERHLDFGDYRPGYFAFMLTNVAKFVEPLPGLGRLGLFLPDESLVEELKNRKLVDTINHRQQVPSEKRRTTELD